MRFYIFVSLEEKKQERSRKSGFYGRNVVKEDLEWFKSAKKNYFWAIFVGILHREVFLQFNFLEVRNTWRIPADSLALFFLTKTFVFNGFIRCGFRVEVPIRQMCKIRRFCLILQTINRNALFLQLNCIIFFSFFHLKFTTVFDKKWLKSLWTSYCFYTIDEKYWKFNWLNLIKQVCFFTVISILSIFFFMISVYSYAEQEAFWKA